MVKQMNALKRMCAQQCIQCIRLIQKTGFLLLLFNDTQFFQPYNFKFHWSIVTKLYTLSTFGEIRSETSIFRSDCPTLFILQVRYNDKWKWEIVSTTRT